MRWALFVCLFALLLPVAEATAQQQGTIAGTVTDGTGTAIADAYVLIEDTDLSTLTNTQGRFLIRGVPAGEVTVTVSLLGYRSISQTVTVQPGETVSADFQLGIQAIELEGIVAVGYGTQAKANLTGAVASVSGEEMAVLPVPNVSQALQGMAPGLQVVDFGGQPGENGAAILVRGQGTLGSTSRSRPLVLIDGVEGDLNAVDIEDVESISVLKDAASASIYGSRAANGVILINTKRADADQDLQITYNGYVGMQDITSFPERVSIEDHMRLTNVSYVNSGRDPKYSEEYIQNTLSGTDPLRYPNTDWVDALFSPAPIQDHTVRVTGGSQAARYALSVNYLEEGGLMPNTGADRYNVRLNTDFTATDRLTGGLDLSGNRQSWLNPGMDWESTFYLIHDVPPTAMNRFPDGTWGWSDTNRNPVAYATESGQRERDTWAGTATGRLNYDILPGWAEIQGLASVRYSHYSNEHFITEQRFTDYWNPDVVRRQWGPNQLWRDMNDGMQTTLRAMVDYGHTFQETHDISGVIGYEQIHQQNEWFGANRREFYNNQLRQIDLGNAELDSNWGGANEWALRSGFGRINYSLLGRYLFEANARYDGSSRFAEGNRYGFFPSFSAGWRISEEPFFNVDWIDELKIRGSWGQLGNQDVGLYQYFSTINLGQPYYFGGQLHTGAAKTSLTNTDITWETTTATDVGVDLLLLDSRLSISGDIYERVTDDILLTLPIPAIVGRGAPTQNAGSVKNTGWEFALGWQDNTAGDFSYNIDFNLSDNRNEVLDLVGTGPYVDWVTVTQEGDPINSLYGYEALGLFQSQEEIDNHARQNPNTHPGDVKWKDQNGDGIINHEDRVVIGSELPHYQFGFRASARWNNFDGGFFLQGVGEQDRYVILGLAEGPIWENYTTTWHLDYWTPENPDARVPAPYLYQNHSTGNPSSWWVLDAKYVKLRNVQLGYTIPDQWTERAGMNDVRLYVTGKNLLQWTPMELGLDPEYPGPVGDYYPQTQVISIGTNITF